MSFTSFALIGQHSCCASLFYHFIHWASSTHLLILYLFLLHGLVAKFLELPRHFLLYLYLLVPFWAYWPLNQPIELTNSFTRLPRPIYFFFSSYYFHRLTTLFLVFLRPICSLFKSFYFHGPASHQSWCFSLLGLLPYFFVVLPLISFSSSLLLGFFCCWDLCQKMGINR